MNWNPWHGCERKSEGCKNCYVFGQDGKYGRDASAVYKTSALDLPVQLKADGTYKVPFGSIVFTCFTSDFLIEQADEWRRIAWNAMYERADCTFLFITKRIERLKKVLPENWGEGYHNVHICCTCENQRTADERLPVFLSLPIKHRSIVLSPLLEKVDISPWLSEKIEEVVVGGEQGKNARLCAFSWVNYLKEQCETAAVNFFFKHTGALFEKDGKVYRIPKRVQYSQAESAGLNRVFHPEYFRAAEGNKIITEPYTYETLKAVYLKK